MPTSTSLSPVPKTYAALASRLDEVVAQGRRSAHGAVERVRARTYWEMGRLINGHIHLHDGRARYGERVVERLVPRMKMSPRLIYEIRNFHRAFPSILRAPAELEWTHYNLLTRVEDSKQREALFQETLRKGWPTEELRRRIGRLRIEGPVPGMEATDGRVAGRVLPPLKPRRGKFFTYRIVKPRSLHPGPGFYSIDLGFGNHHALKLTGIRSPRVGDIVEARRTRKDPRGDRYRFKRVGGDPRAARGLLYTY